MLHIQSELKRGLSIPEICDPLGIKYTMKDGKVILTYDQIESPKTNPIVQECRGLILYTNNWDVACFAFRRFFNYGETGADILPDDLSGCLVLPKLDGTMANLYFDRTNETWQVATRSMMYAEGPVSNLENKTFAQLFWEAGGEKLHKYLYREGKEAGPTHLTFTFELTGPLNRIVTPYSDTKITLITARSNDTLAEKSRVFLPAIAAGMDIDYVKPVKITDWKELQKMEGLAATDEGFVVVRESHEGSHKRVKVKNPSYLALHRLVSSVSERHFLELIKQGEADEVIVYYPEYKKYFDDLLTGLRRIEEIIKNDWLELYKIEDRKSFAIEAVKRKFPGILFQMRDGKVTNLGIDLLLLRSEKLLEMIHSI